MSLLKQTTNLKHPGEVKTRTPLWLRNLGRYFSITQSALIACEACGDLSEKVQWEHYKCRCGAQLV